MWPRAPLVLCLLGGLARSACREPGGHDAPEAGPPRGASTASAGPSGSAASESPSSRVAPLAPRPAQTDAARGCPDGMALLEGRYCLRADHRCLEQETLVVAKGSAKGSAKGHCKRYDTKALCAGERRRPVRFCMDRFEWPGEPGVLPRTLTSWNEAKALCEGVGKRLCTEDEFNFACEGEELRPFVYGYLRDPTICNFDKPYRERTYNYAPWDECMATPACKAAFDALDQRAPTGSHPRCMSPEGVFDLNGNVNEWVMRPEQGFSKRSGLKGGWWGPVRNRCRPMTTFHGESDYGYEQGFRCCRDAAPPTTSQPSSPSEPHAPTGAERATGAKGAEREAQP